MGQFVFSLPSHWQLEKRTASTVHVVGLDGIPWPCKISLDRGRLSIQRNRDESGHVFIAYPFEEFGELVISTGTLPESNQAYSLLLELARGTANRLRNQLSIWEEGGLVTDESLHDIVNSAVNFLGSAIMTNDHQQKSDLAARSLELSMQAIFKVSEVFGHQVLPVRNSQINCNKYWFAVQSSRGALVSHAKYPFADLIQFEAPLEIGSDIVNAILGPVLDASPGGMASTFSDADNFDERQSLIIKHCRELIQQVPASVKLIHAVSRINGMGHRSLSYPQQLQVTLEILQTIENFGIQIPAMISFDTPWAERLAWSVGGVHPLQIADSILRRGVSLSMIGLDINLDYWPGGSLPRDPIQWIETIDVWAQLGLPLVIRLSAPTQVSSLVATTTNRPLNGIRESVTDSQLLSLLRTVIPMLLARPAVQGIIWSQEQDGDDPHTAFRGAAG